MSRNNFCPDSRSYGVVIRTRQENLPMSDQFLLTQAQLKRIESHFPKPRGDGGRVVGGIIHVIQSLFFVLEIHLYPYDRVFPHRRRHG